MDIYKYRLERDKIAKNNGWNRWWQIVLGGIIGTVLFLIIKANI